MKEGVQPKKWERPIARPPLNDLANLLHRPVESTTHS